MTAVDEHRSLRLRVRHIQEDGEDYPVELDEPVLADLLRDIGGVYRTAGRGLRADFRLSRCVDTVSVRGRLSSALAFECSRCLASLIEAVEVDIRWTFLPVGPYRASLTANEEVELTADDLEVSFYEGDEIDLSEVVREALLLELKPFPTCTADCEANLEDVADAEAASVDPRWLPLLDIQRKRRS